jgi:hypothetical protein
VALFTEDYTALPTAGIISRSMNYTHFAKSFRSMVALFLRNLHIASYSPLLLLLLFHAEVMNGATARCNLKTYTGDMTRKCQTVIFYRREAY